MKHTVEEFFHSEISEMNKNIERIEHGLEWGNKTDPALAGQREILALQREHLGFLEHLAQTASTYYQAATLCRELILTNEQEHRKIAQRETSYRNSPEWWHSLHQIQYGTALLHRIEAWQAEAVS